ncbi:MULTISPECIES: helix-turn-helix domain-containing protein [Empedobacter]|uniref:Helix-turn-helix domain-containing protein n=1 Tax=Empedobacter falsenii TaxID=343874 RepID=A0A7H9DXB6_9FLAO|nr:MULTISPECIES: helix-turn-helix domain-containing protein [Empedobacter]MDH2207096.1 helix-turn-helix domain-containing protein [Empedobacter sp. GD03644]QLL59381.1 helix-turn-helix domain-containing protein [Empedobacter falsenii]
MNNSINYKALYTDIINDLYPDELSLYQDILNKEQLSFFDISKLNRLIFLDKNRNNSKVNQKFKSYQEKDILFILDYQKINKLNNTQLAIHFKLSRNTVAKWKKNYI